MNIVTISTGSWVNNHLKRWVRLVKQSNPGAWLGLIYIDDGTPCDAEVVNQFDRVAMYGAESKHRDFYNVVRMGATTIFGKAEIIYCDCDADVVGDIGRLADYRSGELAFCKSPAESQEWLDYAKLKGHEPWMANNGLLVLGMDFTEEYQVALQKVVDDGLSERMRGTYAFNMMVRSNLRQDLYDVIPPEYGVIWWDVEKFATARIIQFCSDHGQAKRLMLEKEWEDAQ